MESPRVEVHRSLQSVRWGDMDALGHVNNTLYFRYMEQARLEWLHSFIGHDRPYDEESRPLIVNASCTFFEPIVYPAKLEVVMALGEAGRTSIGSYYQILLQNHRVAEGEARMVWISRADGRPTPLPETVRALLARSPASGSRA
jgi:acyl-CoA thioester hydrolase